MGFCRKIAMFEIWSFSTKSAHFTECWSAESVGTKNPTCCAKPKAGLQSCTACRIPACHKRIDKNAFFGT
jgi:hypothetical protein